MEHTLNVFAEYAGMISCKESAARVTKATLGKHQFHCLVLAVHEPDGEKFETK